MNEKEISEIRRRLRPDKNNIAKIRGCYVNENKEIISNFNQSFALMNVEESEEILRIIRKSLSGVIGRNLIDISFSNNQVISGCEHQLLSTLRSSRLEDDNAFNSFISNIKNSLNFNGNYLIMLVADTYDVPNYHTDGTKNNDGNDIFTYIICCICPIKMTKSALGFHVTENKFKSVTPDWIISAPCIGFMFPCFDGRRANIYNALYYTKDISNSHTELTDVIFGSKLPMPALEQKQVFDALLRDNISSQCSLDVIKSLQTRVWEMTEEHKATKDPDPLVLSKDTVVDILETCGVEGEKIDCFANNFESCYGKHAELTPINIIDSKKLSVNTPEVSIRLSSDMSDKIETRIIDGQKYVLIKADGIVEVNGIEISIQE